MTPPEILAQTLGQDSQDDIQATWIAYKETHDIALRNELILHYRNLVRYVVYRVSSGMPSVVDREDLASYGQFGLIDAIERFDLDKGVKFETYAITRIRGSILDEMRALDWVPRSVRAKARDVERVAAKLELELGRMPEDEELAEAMGITVGELWIAQSDAQITSVTTLEDVLTDEQGQYGHGSRLFDSMANPEDSYMVDEVIEMLAKAISKMSERSQIIMVLYYIEEMTLSEIGEVLGVTESRVCQLQGRLLQSLRESLGHGRSAA